jgi:hypothetical protein
MATAFVRSECLGERPSVVEVTPTCVFVRQDFTEFEQVDEEGKETGVTGWSYEEARLSHGEYAEYATTEQQQRYDLLEGVLLEALEIIGGDEA